MDTATGQPIGLFDSGVGGLSVYQHLASRLPSETYLYYADTANVPYGDKSAEQILAYTLDAVDWLYHHGCKLVVLACNSASAHALQVVRSQFSNLPIVGLVPAVKPAVLVSQTKKIAVLATQATLNGKLLQTVIDDVATPRQTQIIKYFNADLVPWVESGMPLESPTAQHLLNDVRRFQRQQVDHIVLGCTHYPFFKSFLQQYIAAQNWPITVIDSGSAIAARVASLLATTSEPNGRTNDTNSNQVQQNHCQLQFYASAFNDHIKQVVANLVQHQVVFLNEKSHRASL